MKKFDIVFSNPPYSTGKHNFEQVETDLAMLEKVLELSQHCTFVMTGRLLYKSQLKEYRKKLNQYCQYIEIFNGNKTFDVKLTFPFIVISLNKHKKQNKIKIVDRIAGEEYQINNLAHFNKYKFNDEEFEWWQNFLNTPMKDSYEDHCIGWYQFDQPLGYCLNSSSSANITIYDTVVQQSFTFTDKNKVTEKTTWMLKSYNKRWHIIPIKQLEDAEKIKASYRCQIIRAIIDVQKHSWRTMTKTTKMLPFPVDENGQLQYFTNEDWIKKLNMPQSVADKILKYYQKHTELQFYQPKYKKNPKYL